MCVCVWEGWLYRAVEEEEEGMNGEKGAWVEEGMLDGLHCLLALQH